MIELITLLAEIVKSNPNDYDLGKKVRILVNSDSFQKELEKIKDEKEKGKVN